MAIELELPEDTERTTWEDKGETASTAAADQAVGLLEADTEPEAADEGSETEGLNGETISATTETTSQVGETKPEAATVSADNWSATITVQKSQPSPQEIAQAAWKQRIREISDELAEAALDRLEAECRFKAAKNREKAIVEQLSEVMKEGPRVMPLFDLDRQDLKPRKIEAEVDDVDDSDQQPSTSVVAESVAPDAQTWAEWRSVPIAELNLKPKLNERLEEAGATTIGRLEDLRAEISQGREKWPKGIGKAKITEIEDAVINWLSKNRDAQVLADAQAHPQAHAETVQNESADPSATVEEAEFDPCARAVELEEQGMLGYEHPEGNGYWKSGFDAYNQDAKVSECPYVAGPEADDWICGWLSAAKVDQYHHKYDKTNDSVEAASLDDL